MLEVYERLGLQADTPVDAHLVLNHEQREKARLRLLSAEGDEIRLFLERGRPLVVGECLRSSCGKTLLVEGAVEPVITARCEDWLTFSRACYHLGNRHVKVQIGDCWLRIAPDHVLEDMLKQLGLETCEEQAVFTPEYGAYSHHNSHGHHAH